MVEFQLKQESKKELEELTITLDFNGDSLYLREQDSDLLIGTVKFTSVRQMWAMRAFLNELLNRIEVGRTLVLEEVDENRVNRIDEWNFD